jgi:hypothetical protein
MADQHRRYWSYLLRLSHVGGDSARQWRITLEDVQTRQQRAFADLASLIAFLDAHMTGQVSLEQSRPNPTESEERIDL